MIPAREVIEANSELLASHRSPSPAQLEIRAEILRRIWDADPKVEDAATLGANLILAADVSERRVAEELVALGRSLRAPAVPNEEHRSVEVQSALAPFVSPRSPGLALMAKIRGFALFSEVCRPGFRYIMEDGRMFTVVGVSPADGSIMGSIDGEEALLPPNTPPLVAVPNRPEVLLSQAVTVGATYEHRESRRRITVDSIASLPGGDGWRIFGDVHFIDEEGKRHAAEVDSIADSDVRLWRKVAKASKPS